MKFLLTLIGFIIAFSATAEGRYIPPTKLTAQEKTRVKATLEKNKTTLKAYWQNRLLSAKANDQKLAKYGTPLQKPYYGDYKQKN